MSINIVTGVDDLPCFINYDFYSNTSLTLASYRMLAQFGTTRLGFHYSINTH